jgi:16S rRNA (cytidine1402-2'-O)-methyltransferase
LPNCEYRFLAQADIVACEDTRISRKLLTAYGISKPLVPVHQHNMPSAITRLVVALKEGKRVVYISDAGMPGVSDPGGYLVQQVRAQHIPVTVVPGPSAVTTALPYAGLEKTPWTFVGFLPSQKGHRQRMIAHLCQAGHPFVVFEGPHRLLKTLEALEEGAPGCHLHVVKELTKIHEAHLQGTPLQIIEGLCHQSPQGEYVLIIEPKDHQPLDSQAWEAELKELLTQMKVKEAAALLAGKWDLSAREVYQKALELKDGR